MKTTIFYENSFGMVTQYTGEVLEKTQSTITIKFSPKKAYKFDLKANSDFLIVCKNKIKPLEVLKSSFNFSFDEKLRNDILFELEKNNNILEYWDGKKFANWN